MTKVMVVTGGSRGIGAATARLAAARGYAVCVNYVKNEKAAKAVVADIEAAGAAAIAVKANVAEESDVKRLFRTVDQELGPLDALINNAGIVNPAGRVEDMTAERVNRILALNVTGCFLCAREAIKRMSTAHDGAGGAIVNVSSAAARLGGPGEFVDYAASKGAIDTFTTGLALEVAAQGIRVNAVRPGIIETEIHAAIGKPERVAEIGPTVPMGRSGTAAEVAEAILWLCSDAASYVDNSFVEISGGR